MCALYISYKPKTLVEVGVVKMWLYGQRTLFIPVVLTVGLSIGGNWELVRNANF